MTPAPTRTLRVVVADDDAMLREMLSGLLDDLGFAVVAAVGDGAAAVQAARDLVPDVVLLDHRMPNLTGIEAARQLRELLPDLPSLILSAYDDAGLQRAAKDAGATNYLVKGCTAAQIAEAIETACTPACPATPRDAAQTASRRPRPGFTGSAPR